MLARSVLMLLVGVALAAPHPVRAQEATAGSLGEALWCRGALDYTVALGAHAGDPEMQAAIERALAHHTALIATEAASRGWSELVLNALLFGNREKAEAQMARHLASGGVETMDYQLTACLQAGRPAPSVADIETTLRELDAEIERTEAAIDRNDTVIEELDTLIDSVDRTLETYGGYAGWEPIPLIE